jgi:PAS domain S-box-containing protein
MTLVGDTLLLNIKGVSATKFPSPFDRAFDQAGIGMALVGLDGRWLHVNRAVCDLVGYTREELLERTFQDITHPEDLDADLAQVGRLLRGEIESYQMQKRYLHRCGHVVWILLTGSVLRDDAGQPQMFIAQIQDITVWKQASVTTDTVFELPIALHFVAGFDGRFKKLSTSWTQVLGYSVETLLATPFLEFVHPDDREKTVEQSRKTMAGSETTLFENRYRHADGSYRWILWTSISKVAEQLTYGVALDYTARKEAELELQQALIEQRRLYEELRSAAARIEQLRSGLVTVCAWTKQIQHDGRWISADEFLRDHLQLNLTHGMSEEAAQKFL